jgi:hypothetical protein
MKGDADGSPFLHGSDFPPVTIRCPDCGAFLREVAHVAGDSTVVACGPCGETFRLSAQCQEWLHTPSRNALPDGDSHTVVNMRPRKARTK